ncbi:MAG: aldo/keto reductase [Pseudomonadota bacterium]
MIAPTEKRREIGATGLALTALGFGGASVGNLYRASSDDVAFGALQAALDHGVGYFDTAPHYGHGLSEVRFGQFFSGRKPAGVVLSTKVGRRLEPAGPDGPPDHGFVSPLPFTQVYDYSYDGVMRSFEDSLARLQGLTVDVLLMHDIGALIHGQEAHAKLFREAMNGGMKALTELRAAGDVKAIGLGVNEWQVCLESLEHADIDVFMLAGRHTLMETEAEQRLFPACADKGVSVIAAAPFNSGLLSRRPDPASTYNYKAAAEDIVERASQVFDIADQHGTPLQAAALQFPLRHDIVVSVVGGMATAERVASSAAWMKEPITDDLWAALTLQREAAGR